MNPYYESSPFDTEMNEGLISNTFDTKSSALASITGGAVATAVDIGASLWNSIPGTDEADTEEILGRIGGDALRVYQENPDTIRALSFVGGALLPGALAVKGMNLARNGSKAVNWFTTAGKQTDIAKASKLLLDGKKATSEYRNLLWGMRGRTALNAVADAAAAEVAMISAFNSHPYMEDYLEDPIKNFGISMAFGGGIGVAGGLIGDAFQLNKALGAAEATVQRNVLGAIKPTFDTMPDATMVQTMDMSIKNLANILAKRAEEGKNITNDLTYQFADKMKKDLEVRQREVFDSILSPEMRDLPIAEKDKIMNWLRDDNGAFGVAGIKFASEPAEVLKRYKADEVVGTEAKLKIKNLSGKEESVTAYYYPEIGKYGTKKDLEHHAGVAILGLTPEQLLKRYPDRMGLTPNTEFGLEALGKNAASVEADYAGWTLKFSRMDDDAVVDYLSKSTLSAEDVPQIQAILNRLEGNMKLKGAAKIKIMDRLEAEASLLNDIELQRTAGGTPVRYKEAVERTLNNRTVDDLYDIRNSGTPAAASALEDWVSGDTFGLHEGAVAYFARGYAARSLARAPLAQVQARQRAKDIFQAIYEHPRSIKLREDMAKLADKDGKVYLYRGVTAPKIFGQSPLESMAVTLEKTSQFTGAEGRSLLYKVDVDDIVTAVHDIGRAGDNVEVIVRASAREAEAVVLPNGNIHFRDSLAKNLSAAKKTYEARYGDLVDYLYEGKYKLMQSLIGRGYPVDSIAKRLNMTNKSVEQFLATDRSYESFERMTDIRAFRNEADVAYALSPSQRPLALRGNMKKADYTKKHSDLNARALTNIDTLAKGAILFTSKSAAVRELGTELLQEQKHALDLARSQLHMVTQSLAGNRFFTSADQFARKMGDLGPMFSYIGKRLEKIANKEIEEVVAPITKAMEDVSTDLPSLTEFSVAANLNASLSEWRIYKDRQFWQKVERLGEDGKKKIVLEAVKYEGKDFVIATDAVDTLLTEVQARSGRLYELSNAGNKILGKADLNNIGFWMPSFNPTGKFIAYVHDRATDVTKILYGKTPQELQDSIAAFGPELQKNPNLLIVEKSNQEWWSKLNGRLDPIRMQRADIGQRKGGSAAQAIPKITTEVLAEIASGYEHHINAQVRNLADLTMSDITDTLRQLSSYNKRLEEGQPLNFLQKAMHRQKDPAASMRALLLGNPSLGEYESWVAVNRSFENAIGIASNAVGNIWKQAVKPRFGNPLRKSIDPADLKAADYEKFVTDLEQAGVVNPFAEMDKAMAVEQFGLSRLMDNPEVSKRAITASNGLAATMALRFAELAHPIVNLVSMPILMTLANTKGMPSTFMGVAKGTANVPITQVIFEGARAMNSARFASLSKKWEDLGYYKPLVSEASDVLRQSRQFEKGIIPGLEKALESKFVEAMSKPADMSEAFSRKYMMHAGAVLAKRLYPELDDNGVTIFARDFMDKALGNYSASQRPVFFQGTLGVAMGLFQTYMLTMAQNIYKNVEFRDWQTLAKATLAQSTIFGTSSLPGFDLVSKSIAENFSDDNYDLTTGTYRALGDPVASWTLYGLPSNLTGAGFYTRGDIDPRFPNVLDSVTNLVGVNFAMQAGASLKQFATAVSQDDEDVGQAFLQALSLQSMSRPLARGAEIASGYSVTQAGNTVQTPDEVRTINGIIARVLGTRPMEEAKLREADHLRRYYDTLDRDRREVVLNKLKTSIRNGTLNDEKMAEAAEEYLRFGGSPRGWKTAFNNAIARTNTPGDEEFVQRLDEDSPFLHMMSDLD